MYQKTFLCLANSWKPPSGRCLAGKEITTSGFSGWIRPVSDRPSREVSEEERLYRSGRRAQLLDKVAVQFLRHEPVQHQVENHVLDDKVHFGHVGRGSWADVVACLDEYDPAFWIPCASTQFGCRDKLLAAQSVSLGSSLKLVQVDQLRLHVGVEHNPYDGVSKRKVRGEFDYGGATYRLSVTDPEVNVHYLGLTDGQYVVANPALCISVVEVWNGYAFRVIASVITANRCAALAAQST